MSENEPHSEDDSEILRLGFLDRRDVYEKNAKNLIEQMGFSYTGATLDRNYVEILGTATNETGDTIKIRINRGL